MPEAERPQPPRGWAATENGAGALELRVPQRGRRALTAAAALLAALCLGGSWFVPAAGLALFAAWCAFADEVWCVGANVLEHRVGIGRLGFERMYRDADLEVIRRTTTNWSVPYWRLYALASGERHFLFGRTNFDELQALARFIAFRTGWSVRQN